MAKRKLSTVAAAPGTTAEASIVDRSKMRRTAVPVPSKDGGNKPHPARRQPSRGGPAVTTDPNVNPEVLDGVNALRASPDGHEESAVSNHAPAVNVPTKQTGKDKAKKGKLPQVKKEQDDSHSIALVNGLTENVTGPADDTGVPGDPEAADELENDDEAEVKAASLRPPPVNSGYLPLPWKGRLGYACLNTYLRNANPPVFSSRTCRIASILEHRHPLKDPSQPEHATKNRPDKDQPADVGRGMRYVEELGLANARDISKMVRWNDKYGIKFMRLSSEMFPFASHEEYGYTLEPFAADTLREVGEVIAELGHRVTTHPGQFTQLGSPRKSVIDNAVRDLVYHAELLSLLKLPQQQDRDAVMIMHLGGAFGDKPAAIERFKENYAKLPDGVKKRLVLENDDVVWCTHEILPLCQELNIPFVLDFHHHNILFDSTQIREGTKDIVDLFPKILETWTKKGITPKMHYSEPCPGTITGRDRRKHSPRVMTLPPCPDTMDLMIEAKDKEQAVFELMRTLKLPGFHLINEIVPHQRQDENKPFKPKPKKAVKKGRKQKTDDLDDLEAKIEQVEEEEVPPPLVPEDELGMGGPERRVYWPPTMEDWLRPAKRVIKKKEEGAATPAKKKQKTVVTPGDNASIVGEPASIDDTKIPAKKAAPKRPASTKKKAPKSVPTPSPSDDEDSLSSPPLSEGDEDEAPVVQKRAVQASATRKKSGRATASVSYKEEDVDEMVM
ncbi:UV-endonuclease UvdE [Dothidotthia symphoricarpi CBS 119687]|uniref:UV-endonuclease UvdE n=1 Tax=Dothidotthia symphoricarpi CBS 119687 TaxID=1392245 RepID=A0A6A6AG61_9PLEO|nr:UV-endonuclease UvdE [Dothidotthia symphoricarpi CBS 119687]KAF2130899.1 UV-endonuclease UvdE [Dothidotthia symphoricarpi CBS 119687]